MVLLLKSINDHINNPTLVINDTPVISIASNTTGPKRLLKILFTGVFNFVIKANVFFLTGIKKSPVKKQATEHENVLFKNSSSL